MHKAQIKLSRNPAMKDYQASLDAYTNIVLSCFYPDTVSPLRGEISSFGFLGPAVISEAFFSFAV